MQRQTADIIAFPVAAVAQGPAAPERLARALAELERALAGQRAAVAKWREGVTDLQASVGQLGRSMAGLQDSLATLAARNAEAHAEAVHLEAWADGVMGSGPQN